ncbi:hypothetical protein [Acrocarpospora sp. B8E8]|uniref:hypothetical protein n=1 Tax=Acrocarpospora sp. B8E8 TaxID=3153572 RepID=UPI00325F9139
MAVPDFPPETAERISTLEAMSPGEKHVALKYLIGHSPGAFDAAVELVRWLRSVPVAKEN